MLYKKAFCDFVLNEGIMPSVLTRIIRSNIMISDDSEYIAQILEKRCDFNPTNPHLTDETKKSIQDYLNKNVFEMDEALMDWLKKVSLLLQLIMQPEIYPGIAIPNAQKDWAISTLIKSCPLVSENIKDEYLSDCEQKDKRDAAKERHNMLLTPEQKESMLQRDLKIKEQFGEHFFKRTRFISFVVSHDRKTKVTAMAYRSALNTIENKYNINVWAMNTPNEVDEAIEKLEKNEDFCQANAKTHGALIAAMRKYRLFISVDV